jgi:uncharacterized protein YecE (DUF72 family)
MFHSQNTYSNIHVGCQAWSYHWWITQRGGPPILYPQKTKSKDYLSIYSKVFDTVEIDGTFRYMPEVKNCESWYRQTPEHFRFSAKLLRDITHEQGLRKSSFAIVDEFLEKIEPLREKLAVLLIQLPGSFQMTDTNRRNLEDFLAYLPGEKRFAIEFRAADWFNEEIFALLRKYDISMCLGESDYVSEESIVQAFDAPQPDMLYLRFGGSRDLLEYYYIQRPQDERIGRWIERLKSAQNKEVFVYFSNFIEGNSPASAMNFRRQLGQKFTAPSELDPNQSLF